MYAECVVRGAGGSLATARECKCFENKSYGNTIDM
jgi:hypothetical protein